MSYFWGKCSNRIIAEISHLCEIIVEVFVAIRGRGYVYLVIWQPQKTGYWVRI